MAATTTRALAPCGTPAAHARHLRRGEPIDDACRAANTAAQRNLKFRGSTSAHAPHSGSGPVTDEEQAAARVVLAHATDPDDARLLMDALFGPPDEPQAEHAGGATCP